MIVMALAVTASGALLEISSFATRFMVYHYREMAGASRTMQEFWQKSMETTASENLSLEEKIFTTGKKVYQSVKDQESGWLRKNLLADKAMGFASRYPQLKTGLLQFVDVLPTLQTSEKIADHLYSYAGQNPDKLPRLFRELLKNSNRWVPDFVLSRVAKLFISQVGSLFIAGKNAEQALPKLRKILRDQQAFTVDLLGEYSLSEGEAKAYLNRYLNTLNTLGQSGSKPPVPGGSASLETQFLEVPAKFKDHPTMGNGVNISVKLSALYSQCTPANYDKSVEVLSERLGVIARKAREVGGQMYVDAEDSFTNPMIYAAFKKVFGSREFRDFPYAGIVVQAYNRESYAELESLISFARKRSAPIAVRLVKGAYWDQELAMCQLKGWEFPLYTHKQNSDYNFERCSRLLVDNAKDCFPAFASHNIRSLSHAVCYAKSRSLSEREFEIQMLYGMSGPLAPGFTNLGYLVRLYVPMGKMLPGIGYLVRRLLENTANESFINHMFLQADSLEDLMTPPTYMEETGDVPQ